MQDAWVVAASMGYGHLRAAAPLLPIAYRGELVIANDYPGIPEHDRRVWAESERFYNFISRFREAGGVAGRALFSLYDHFQAIRPLVPGVPETRASVQVRFLDRETRHGLGRDLVERLARDPRPLVTTFFSIGHAAAVWRYPAPTYVVVTDSDISRVWAPVDAARTVLRYCAPTDTAARHLERYGVPRSRITVTGFPLPGELTDAAAERFGAREERLRGRGGGPCTLLFSVGGAGAQSQIGKELIRSLAPRIRAGAFRLILSAGVSPYVAAEFEGAVRDASATDLVGKGIELLVAETKLAYFQSFNAALARTDILWTKPSELSFYAALGLPIIIAPPVGAQEERNRAWLLELGAGMNELDPQTAHEWIPDHIQNGTFAEAAQNGYQRMERNGARHIMEAVTTG